MPIYEYDCKNCGERFQIFLLPGEDENKTACPRCSARAVTKVISLGNAVSEPSSSSECKTTGST